MEREKRGKQMIFKWFFSAIPRENVDSAPWERETPISTALRVANYGIYCSFGGKALERSTERTIMNA